MTGADPLPPLRTRLRTLRPAAFGADPGGARMERIRRSPNFADGVFQNPVGARTRPSGSTLEFAKVYFRKEERARRAPVGTVPVHATTYADLAEAPATGLRLTWMGHSSVLAEIDGRMGALRPGVGRALFTLRLRRAQAAAPGAAAAGRPRPGGRGGDLPRPLRPPRYADDPRARRYRHGVRRPAGGRRPPGAVGRVPRPGARARLERDDEDRRDQPDRHPGAALLRPRPAQPAAHPLGVLGRQPAPSTGSITAATPAISRASRTSAPNTARSTRR